MSTFGGGIFAAGGPSLASWRCAEPTPVYRVSMVGRPRRLTDAQVAMILSEHARYLAWRALRMIVKSPRQLAQELGVVHSTVSLAIRSKGQYKQSTPESRSVGFSVRRKRLVRLRKKGLL